jgi:hypothetical protein
LIGARLTFLIGALTAYCRAVNLPNLHSPNGFERLERLKQFERSCYFGGT